MVRNVHQAPTMSVRAKSQTGHIADLPAATALSLNLAVLSCPVRRRRAPPSAAVRLPPPPASTSLNKTNKKTKET